MKTTFKIFAFSIIAFSLLSSCEPIEPERDYRLQYVGIYDFTVFRKTDRFYLNPPTFDTLTMYHQGVINLYNIEDENDSFFPSTTQELNVDSGLTIHFLPNTHITTSISPSGLFRSKMNSIASSQSGGFSPNSDAISFVVDFWPSRMFHDTYTVIGVKTN